MKSAPVKLLLFVLALGCLQPEPGRAGPADRPGWKLTFDDEFDGKSLDSAKWNPNDPWGRERNHELQAYVKDAFVVSNGVLRIVAEKRAASYAGQERSYTSGIMATYGKFSQEYGRFEIRCRVPKGKGMWPAFWLLPDPLDWPPEIDVLEILGHEPAKVHGKMYMLVNLAVGGDWPGAPDENTRLPAALEIDYVRVYTRAR